jgi:5'(3')-deoxyribonucleotidase
LGINGFVQIAENKFFFLKGLTLPARYAIIRYKPKEEIKMTRRIIAFDMDGTIADLYGVENWLQKLLAEDATPYTDAAPMWNMEELREVLLQLIEKGWEVRVITWLAKDSTEEYKTAVRKAKNEWLVKYNFPANRCHMVAYGTTKANCIRKFADNAILIDDNEKVRNGWTMGETINPVTEDLIERLRGLL